MHGSVGRVGLDVECVHLDTVSMHVHCICPLGKVQNTCRIGSKTVAYLVVIITIIASHGIFVQHIGIHHITKRFSYGVHTIPYDAVSNQFLTVITHLTTVQQSQVVILGVHITQFRIDMATTIVYGTRSPSIGY